MRVEVEYGWQKNDLDTLSYANRIGNFGEGDLKTQSLMVNGYYDIDTDSPWTPFIGAGVGWAKVDLNPRPCRLEITTMYSPTSSWVA